MDEQQLMQAGAQILQKAQQGDQQATQIVQMAQQVMQDQNMQQEIMQKAQQGDQGAMLVVATAMAMQQTQSARFGAKLNYIKFLRDKCPTGYEMQSFRKGGAICQKCVKKMKKGEVGMKTSNKDVVSEFRCGRKMKKK